MSWKSKLTKIAKDSLKIKGGVRQGGKSKWLTAGTPENDRFVAAKKEFRNQVRAHVDEGRKLAQGPQTHVDTRMDKSGQESLGHLIESNADASKYSPRQKAAAKNVTKYMNKSQAETDAVIKNPPAPRPLDLATQPKVFKSSNKNKNSAKLQIVIDTAKSQRAGNILGGSKKVKGETEKIPPAEFVKPSGYENWSEVSVPNLFSKNNFSSQKIRDQNRSSGLNKIKVHMDESSKRAKQNTEVYKAKEALKEATPQQLSDAHAVKGPKPKPKKKKAFKPTKKAIQEWNALFN